MCTIQVRYTYPVLVHIQYKYFTILGVYLYFLVKFFKNKMQTKLQIQLEVFINSIHEICIEYIYVVVKIS
jgi:uncharacterized protein YsxB (DUF464 family)